MTFHCFYKGHFTKSKMLFSDPVSTEKKDQALAVKLVLIFDVHITGGYLEIKKVLSGKKSLFDLVSFMMSYSLASSYYVLRKHRNILSETGRMYSNKCLCLESKLPHLLQELYSFNPNRKKEHGLFN